jgi:hypothetical protein
MDLGQFVGREPERLSIQERQALAGKWYALDVYTPQTIPLKRIEALGDSVEECARQLQLRGRNILQYEYTLLAPPF